MRAAILNSGTGSRMRDLSRSKPKCLVEIAPDQTILSRQIGQLVRCGLSDFVITTGPFRGVLEHYVLSNFPDITVDFIHNPEYQTTNYIYSMHLADGLLREDVLLMHGDVVTTDRLLVALLESRMPNVAVVDSTAKLPADDFKGRINGGLIREIRVDIFGADCVYLAPIYKLSRSFMNVWMDEIGVFIDRGSRDVYAEEAFNSIAGSLSLGFIDAKGALCSEIDTPADLAAAKQTIAVSEDETD
jgi:phosphoenolpyruvate phosphomutase